MRVVPAPSSFVADELLDVLGRILRVDSSRKITISSAKLQRGDCSRARKWS
jgi:hypothetical protein